MADIAIDNDSGNTNVPMIKQEPPTPIESGENKNLDNIKVSSKTKDKKSTQPVVKKTKASALRLMNSSKTQEKTTTPKSNGTISSTKTSSTKSPLAKTPTNTTSKTSKTTTKTTPKTTPTPTQSKTSSLSSKTVTTKTSTTTSTTKKSLTSKTDTPKVDNKTSTSKATKATPPLAKISKTTTSSTKPKPATTAKTSPADVNKTTKVSKTTTTTTKSSISVKSSNTKVLKSTTNKDKTEDKTKKLPPKTQGDKSKTENKSSTNKSTASKTKPATSKTSPTKPSKTATTKTKAKSQQTKSSDKTADDKVDKKGNNDKNEDVLPSIIAAPTEAEATIVVPISKESKEDINVVTESKNVSIEISEKEETNNVLEEKNTDDDISKIETTKIETMVSEQLEKEVESNNLIETKEDSEDSKHLEMKTVGGSFDEKSFDSPSMERSPSIPAEEEDVKLAEKHETQSEQLETEEPNNLEDLPVNESNNEKSEEVKKFEVSDKIQESLEEQAKQEEQETESENQESESERQYQEEFPGQPELSSAEVCVEAKAELTEDNKDDSEVLIQEESSPQLDSTPNEMIAFETKEENSGLETKISIDKNVECKNELVEDHNQSLEVDTKDLASAENEVESESVVEQQESNSFDTSLNNLDNQHIEDGSDKGNIVVDMPTEESKQLEENNLAETENIGDQSNLGSPEETTTSTSNNEDLVSASEDIIKETSQHNMESMPEESLSNQEESGNQEEDQESNNKKHEESENTEASEIITKDDLKGEINISQIYISDEPSNEKEENFSDLVSTLGKESSACLEPENEPEDLYCVTPLQGVENNDIDEGIYKANEPEKVEIPNELNYNDQVAENSSEDVTPVSDVAVYGTDISELSTPNDESAPRPGSENVEPEYVNDSPKMECTNNVVEDQPVTKEDEAEYDQAEKENTQDEQQQQDHQQEMPSTQTAEVSRDNEAIESNSGIKSEDLAADISSDLITDDTNHAAEIVTNETTEVSSRETEEAESNEAMEADLYDKNETDLHETTGTDLQETRENDDPKEADLIETAAAPEDTNVEHKENHGETQNEESKLSLDEISSSVELVETKEVISKEESTIKYESSTTTTTTIVSSNDNMDDILSPTGKILMGSTANSNECDESEGSEIDSPNHHSVYQQGNTIESTEYATTSKEISGIGDYVGNINSAISNEAIIATYYGDDEETY